MSLEDDQGLRYARWVERTRLPLLFVALVFVLVLSYPIINPHLTGLERDGLQALDISIWALFAADYAIRLKLVPDRRRFVRTHIPDLAVVLLPAIRPLRLLRLISITRLVARRSQDAFVLGVLRLVAGVAAMLVFVCAVGVLDFERPAKGANITTFGDAIWWACSTVTTVGYGDRFPVTPGGRVLAVVLMVAGVALLGVLTAGIAAWLVEQVSRGAEIEAAVRIEARELLEVRDRLAAIEGHLRSETEGRRGGRR